MRNSFLVLAGLLILVISCKTNDTEIDSFRLAVEKIKDTLDLSQNLNIINIFKNQTEIYYDYDQTKDTLMLQNDLKKLYKEYLGPWGPEGCFNWSEQEFVEFNKQNAQNHFGAIKKRALNLIENNVDSVLSKVFVGVSQYSGHEVKGKYYLYFMPNEMQGFNMGGCDINTMQVNLSNEELTVDGIAKVFPHELNHQIFEISSEKDENYETLLWGVIDEGFAVYFEKQFNENDVLSSLSMTKADYDWCLAHEFEIYNMSKPLFLSKDMEDEQRLRGNQGKFLIKDAPVRLNYFLGYQIVKNYVGVHGDDSWKDIYTKPVMELLEESNYEKYLMNKNQ